MQNYKVYSYRWVVLATYAFLVIPGGMLWLTYSPLEQAVKTIYNPDPVALLLLTAINPILFIIFTFPAGLLTDKKGFKFVVGLGAILQASFGVLRIFPQDVYLIIM
nr:hypothetical protein [Candidatus Njordarchaeum guaymaensis]